VVELYQGITAFLNTGFLSAGIVLLREPISKIGIHAPRLKAGFHV
jgi:energy-converting hydrogenase Eha subunit C